MRLSVDMNLSPRWAHVLQSAGFEAVHWSGVGAPDASDVVVMAYAGRKDVGLPSVWDQLKEQMYLGSDDFVARMQRKAGAAGQALEVPRMQRRSPAEPLEHYVALELPRDEAMARACATGDFALAQVARAFGVHYATVSRAVRRVEAAQRFQ